MERRRYDRLRLYEPVSLKVLSDGPPADPISGKISDVSQGGAAVLVPESLPEGSLVELRTEFFTVLAEVRRCGRSGAEYCVGLEFGNALRAPEVNSLVTHQHSSQDPQRSLYLARATRLDGRKAR